MKKRSFAVLIVLLIALALLWFLWSKPSHVADAEKPSQTIESPAVAPNRGKESATPLKQANPAADMAATEAEYKRTRLEKLRSIAQKSNKEIQFYGLVLDQDNNPIPGVRVTLSIRTAKEVAPDVINDLFDTRVLMTGPDGRFALNDAKGALLSVKSLEKPGYEASEKSLNRAHYWYWRDPSQVFHPDAAHPEVFRMWKQAGAERLVRKGIGHPIPYNGTPTNFDLLNGTSVAGGGDLRVSLIRNPQQIQWGQRNYEWTVTIEVLNGGLIESNDEQMYRAPADGYQQKLVVQMPANAPDWTDEKTVNLYLMLRDGKQYGRAEVKVLVGSDRPATPFYVTTFVNPSGSRNLEYDPLQNVVPSARPQSTATTPKP
jgi:hypothetical protein